VVAYLPALLVRIHAFALRVIKDGWRLTFDPLQAVTIHYVLGGAGTVCIEGGSHVPFSQHSIIVVPARVSRSLGSIEIREGGASP